MLYTLYINFRERMTEHTLPSGDNMKYIIDISEETERDRCLLSLEVIDGTWSIISNEYTSPETENGDAVLSDGKTVTVNVKRTSLTFAVSFVKITEMLCRFKKYILPESISAGSGSDSDICIKNELVSRRHAVIIRTDKGCFINDMSTNGIFINGIKVRERTRLKMFDCIFIFGTKIIFLDSMIAVNNIGDTVVSLAGAEKLRCENTFRTNKPEPVSHAENTVSFDSTPIVLRQPVFEDTMYRSTDISDILKPSIPAAAVLSGTAVLAGNISLSFLSFSGIFLGTSVLISSAVFGVCKLYDFFLNRRTDEKNRLVLEKFKDEAEKRLSEKQEKYLTELDSRYVSSDKLLPLVSDGLVRVRNKDDADFLKVRAGTGTVGFRKYISLSCENDSVCAELYEKYSFLENAPSVIDLCSEKIFCIEGKKENVFSVACSIMMQAAAFSRYADVRTAAFFRESEKDIFGWIKWLPHSFSEDGKQRYTACDERSCKNVLYALTEKFRERADKRKNGYEGRFFPHYVVLCTSDRIFKNEAVQKYTDFPADIGATFIFLNISKTAEKTSVLCGIGGNETAAECSIGSEYASAFARKLAEVYSFGDRETPLPDRVSFFDTISGCPSENDIIKNYKVNKAADGIRSCIGIAENGKPFILDLHEKKHGPHGLVAGTTGSGKSEVLCTMILSIALSYHPDEVSFVLIDYKGGGMSGIFEKLPHIAGVVTNLSEGVNLAFRALVSIRSEIRKRQRIFKELSIRHIDTYMELYRMNKVSEPLPHIIIISDEFAELKKDQPEFIRELVSTSRVGRSLGLHLILATQKPTGVIDDEIWSNSRFRLCLKVSDRSDSIGMLRRPEAAELTAAGRAYIQIGNDEIFEMIQTGYSGSVYDTGSDRRCVRMIETDGSETVLRVNERHISDRTELETAVSLIEKCCSDENIRSCRKLWLEPLPSVLMHDDIRRYGKTDFSAGLVCEAGIIDDPENQNIYPAVFDLMQCSNIIIAGISGSGKTSLVNTMLCSLAENYSPSVFRFSVLDFSGGLFEVFGKLPHCDGVYSSPSIKILRGFFDEALSELERRKSAFAKIQAADYREYSAVKNDIPVFLICLDGYYVFREIYPELEESFSGLSGEASRYGIYFIVTIKQPSDMRLRTRQNFRTFIPLSLADRTEYNDIFGMRPQFDIPCYAGRGFVKKDRILEFQAAVCCTGTGSQRTEKLLERFEKICSLYHDKKSDGTVPRSISETAYCIDLKNIIGSENISAEKYFDMIEKITFGNKRLVWSAEKFCFDADMKNAEYFTGLDGAFSLLLKLKKEFSARNEQRKRSGIFCKDKIDVIIVDMDNFLRCIYDEEYREDMSGITEIFLEKGSGLGIRFISDINKNSVYRSKKAFEIFKSHTMP